MQVELFYYGFNVPFPNIMLPTLCREFSNISMLSLSRNPCCSRKNPTSGASCIFNKTVNAGETNQVWTGATLNKRYCCDLLFDNCTIQKFVQHGNLFDLSFIELC